MLVIKLKRNVYSTKISEIENKITDYDHDKYFTSPELTAES